MNNKHSFFSEPYPPHGSASGGKRRTAGWKRWDGAKQDPCGTWLARMGSRLSVPSCLWSHCGACR